MVRRDYVPEEELWSLLAACDAVVSLRFPTMGETSAAAVRAFSAGKPVVVSAVGAFTELPDSITEPDVAKNIGDFYAQYALPADAFANIVAFAIGQPDDVDINEILFRPTRQEL